MKKITYFLGVLIALIVCSCNKDVFNSNVSGTASITIVNAVPDLPGALINFTTGPINYSQDQASISYQSFFEYGSAAGNLPITVVSAADTLHAVYSGHVNEKKSGIYSLYLFGQASAVQGLLVEDAIPAHQDSVAGARFVNLSTDAQPLNVILDGNPMSQTEFANIAFKQVTNFKSYSSNSAAMATGGYTFDVTDSNGNILTTFFWTFKPFYNHTLVISGSAANGTLAVFQVKNYGYF
jgi:hypothetical protein